MRSIHLWLRLTCLFVVTSLLLVSGCSPSSQSGEAEAIIRTLRPSLTLGSLNGTEPESFGAITGMIGSPTGRILILDGQKNVVQVFDSAGIFLFSFGGPGQGPGELGGACCLAWGPDGLLWIREGENGRYSAFDVGESSARFVTSLRQRHDASGYQTETTFSPDGYLIDVGDRLVGSPPESERIRLFLDSDGEVVTTQVVDLPAPEALGLKVVSRSLPYGGSVRLHLYAPYGPRHLVSNGPRGVWAEAISSSYSVRIHSGEEISDIQGDQSAGPPLSDAERASASDRIAQDQRRTGQSTPPFSVPSHKQPLRALFFDLNDRLWVELSVPDRAPRKAHVYDLHGQILFQAEWPKDLQLLRPGWPGNDRWSLALQVDSFGVHRVVRLSY